MREKEKKKKDPDPQKKEDASSSSSLEEKGLGLICSNPHKFYRNQRREIRKDSLEICYTCAGDNDF